jgi:sugar phosphate isomerase/epimerase
LAWTNDFLISGFSDEICQDKNLVTQLAVCAALGMEFVTLRFLDLGGGVQNISTVTDSQVVSIRERLDEFGLRVSSIGSPLGKIKLLDQEDGTKNAFRSADEYLNRDVRRCCELAQQLECKLLRGFSFYHPVGTEPAVYVEQVSERLRPIVEMCDGFGLTFGLEVEANLVGQNGELLAAIHQLVDHPALVLIFDGANLVTQGYNTQQVKHQWDLMKHAVGWIHVKDYRQETSMVAAKAGVHVDEESLNRFVPVGEGASGYEEILLDASSRLSEMRTRLEPRGISGVFLDLEPHVAGGGQFGGFSGAEGFGRSFRALTELLAKTKGGNRQRG